jgi:HAE1 family hydrophobic/amphiphilic exporter-1
MTLSDVSIRRPVFTAMLSFAILVMGFLALRKLGTDLYPPVDFPMITVQVIYPGASPEDIERDVTKPLEDSVAGISGLSKLQSFTRDSVTFALLQFELGTPLDEATNAVRDRIGGVRGELPSGAMEPVVKQLDIGALPVTVVALTSDGGVNDTRALAEDRLRPILEQVPGVGAVNVVGGEDREVHVDLDLDKLTALGIGFRQVAERIGYENLDLPVGQIRSGPFAVGIRAKGQYRDVEDLRQTVVHMTQDGKQVHLGEVATVTDAWSDPIRYVRNNGRAAVAVEIVKKSGANTVAVSEVARARLAEVVPTLPGNASFEVIADQSGDIKANAHEVWIAIWFGGAMAVLVILVFLLDLRGTMISALALPTSVIGTFWAMDLLGFSLNTMTLLGLSLAIGLLIDDAVVVRESITRRLEAGDSPAEAASRGTREIALAVLATTLSLVAVFVPVAFMTGMVGQFFKQFGLTISIAVLLSLFVAFTLDPMLSARLSTQLHHGKRTGIAGLIERQLDALDAFYKRSLDAAMRNQGLTVGIAVLALVLTGVVATRLPVEFVPKEDRGEVMADLRLPIGSSLEATDAMTRRAEAAVMAIPGVERIYTIVGHEDQANRARFRIRVKDKNQRTEPLSFFEDQVRAALQVTPQAEVNLAAPNIIDGLGDWPPLMLILQGEDLAQLTTEAERVRAMLAAVPGSSDVRVTVTPGRPELHVDIDRAVASDRGLPAALVASTARFYVEGQIVGSLRDGGTEADIRVRADRRHVATPADIAALPLPSPRGAASLGEVATIGIQAGPSEINHFNRMRAITVVSQVANGAALGDVVTGLQAGLTAAPLPEGMYLTIDGQARDMEETGKAMGMAIGIAGLFVFMVLASQFESLVHPFTLMISVPLAMVGAFLGLWVTGKSISMGSQIGIILLMGLVTKNAILLLDGALQDMRDRGASPLEAMRHAGPRRLRPILMTSAAMALGMVPTAIGTGIGAEFRAPMAIAVIGGVLSSTVLTLYVVPVAFLWIEAGRVKVLGWFGFGGGDAQGGAGAGEFDLPEPETEMRGR